MPLQPTPDDIAAAREALVAADPALARVHAQTPPFEWRLRIGGFEGRLIVIDHEGLVEAADRLGLFVWGEPR